MNAARLPLLLILPVALLAALSGCSQRGKATAALEQVGGQFEYDEADPDRPVTTLDLNGSPVTDELLAHLKHFPRLRRLGLPGAVFVTDRGLQHLEGLTELTSLNLNGTAVGDAGLAHLRGLTRLTWLDLTDTQVTDAGLEHVGKLTKLKTLLLLNAKVTDEGLRHLKGLTELEFLALGRPQATKAGLDDLLQALPKLYIRQSLYQLIR
jgi:Leucine-rich repeat (LRR) protein